MTKTAKLLFCFCFTICFSSTAQLKIWGINSQRDGDSTASLWSTTADNGGKLTKHISYAQNPNGLLPVSYDLTNKYIEDGDGYYGFAKAPGSDEETQLLRFDKNGTIKQITVFPYSNLSLFKGDANFLYVVNHSARQLLRVNKANGQTLKIFNLVSDYNMKIIVNGSYLFVYENSLVYQVRNDGKDTSVIIDFYQVNLPADYIKYNRFHYLTADANNIYISFGSTYFIIVPFKSPKAYTIKELADYRLVRSNMAFVNGSIYAIATPKTDPKTTLLLKINPGFTSFKEITLPETSYSFIVTSNSKKLR